MQRVAENVADNLAGSAIRTTHGVGARETVPPYGNFSNSPTERKPCGTFLYSP